MCLRLLHQLIRSLSDLSEYSRHNPAPRISRDEVEEAVKTYLDAGGKVTKFKFIPPKEQNIVFPEDRKFYDDSSSLSDELPN